MDLEETRKPSAKRPRMEATSRTTPQDAGATIPTVSSGELPMSDHQSIESLLAVPVVVIFRTCPSQDGQPLLTGGEAECFVRISFLAQEIDTLMGSAESMFLQQRYCNQYIHDLLLPSSPSEPEATQESACRVATNPTNPMLRPLLPILQFLENKSAPTIQSIYRTLSHLSTELLGCSCSLRQSAEQNWTVATTLEPVDPSMSDEKRKVADLEEELCQRIERVVGMSLVEAGQDEKPKSSARLSQSAQDDQYRRKLFADSDDQNEEVDVDNDGDSQENVEDQPKQSRETRGKERMDQHYALDWKPISEYCSDLFDNVVHVDSPQEETKEGENGDSANSNDNSADDRMHLDESQVEGEQNGESNTNVDESTKGNTMTDNGDMQLDLVNSRIQAQISSENNVEQEPQEGNGGSVASTAHSNEFIHSDEQAAEIDNGTQGSIESQAGAENQTSSGIGEEVGDSPTTQEVGLGASASGEHQGDRAPIPNLPPNELERHPAILSNRVTTQPEGSSFPLTAEDDIEEDDPEDDGHNGRLMCSQRTSSAAEALAILGNNVSRLPTEDISLY